MAARIESERVRIEPERQEQRKNDPKRVEDSEERKAQQQKELKAEQARPSRAVA